MRPLIALAALLALTPAAATQQRRAASSSHVAPLTPAATAAVSAWSAKAAPLKARLRAIPSSASVSQNLAERVAVEQGLRRLLMPSPTSHLAEADRRAADSRIWGQLAEVDSANTAYLKSVLPADGWFRWSRDGRETARDAWLIVQHSSDQEFQRQVLARMEPLARAGEVDGADYALLYDRTEMFAGRPQYYGSQYQCEKGRWVASPMRDPGGVAARRKTLGMSTLAENKARMDENGGC